MRLTELVQSDNDLKSTLCDDLLIDKEYHWSNLCSGMILMVLLCG